MDVEWLFLPLRLLALFSSSFSLSSSSLSSSDVALSSNERAGLLEVACRAFGSGVSIQKKHLEVSPEKKEVVLVQQLSLAGFVVFSLVVFTIDGLKAPFTVLGRFSPRAAAPVLREMCIIGLIGLFGH